MHVSFSLIHPERPDAGERAVRREAQAFLIRSGARLIEALRLVGGEDAVALGYAFRDIVLEAGFSAACSHDRCQAFVSWQLFPAGPGAGDVDAQGRRRN